MTARARFVDSISASPTVRLDLMASPWTTMRTSRFDPPGIKRSRVSTLLADGSRYPASAYDDRVLELHLVLQAADTDAAASAIQNLARELDRHEVNFFEYRLEGMTNSVFFRTVRLALESTTSTTKGEDQIIVAPVIAEPFGYGLEQSLGTFTVHSDPAAAGGLELDGTSGDFASTPDHASLDLTGDQELRGWLGRTTLPPAAQGFLVGRWDPDANDRSIMLTVETSGVLRLSWSTDGTAGTVDFEDSSVTIDNYDSGVAVTATIDVDDGGGNHVVKFYTAQDIDAAAGDWTQLGATRTTAGTPSIHAGSAPLTVGADADGGAPFNGLIRAAQLRDAFDLTGSLVADPDFEAEDAGTTSFADSTGKTWTVQGSAAIVDRNPCHFDLTGIKGDVQAPALIEFPSANVRDDRETVFAIRRRGTPSGAPFLFQCEDMTQGTDTTVQSGSADFSGPGDNFSQCDFTTATMQTRLTLTDLGTPGVDLRGVYRVFLRYNKATSSDGINLQLRWCDEDGWLEVTNDTVATPNAIVETTADLGLVSIPAGLDPVYDADGSELAVADSFKLEIRAERTSGSDVINFDFVVLVPADDRLGIVHWDDDSTSPTDHWVLDAGDTMAHARDASGRVISAAPPQIVGGLPLLTPGETNRLFMLLAVRPEDTWTLTLTTDVIVSYIPRYLSIRPND